MQHFGIAVYKEPVKRPVEETVADLLSRSFTHYTQPPTSVTSGEEYEVIAKPGGIPQILLPPRPLCHRGIYKIFFCDFIL